MPPNSEAEEAAYNVGSGPASILCFTSGQTAELEVTLEIISLTVVFLSSLEEKNSTA